MDSPILVGAVIYDPKVAIIWDTIKQFFIDEGCLMDYVFYSNYELMIDALLGDHIHISWSSPLAWVDAVRRSEGRVRALAMRDTDRDRRTHIVTKKDSGITKLDDLRGKRLATGAYDSPQAYLLPLHMLRGKGLQARRDFEVQRFDIAVGKHGDHIGGERDALRAVESGKADASCVLDLNWATWTTDGTIDPARWTIAGTTAPFDHCNFTVTERYPRERADKWTETLFRMRYDVPAHREMMDLEGLKAWVPGRTELYAALTAAAGEEGFFKAL